MHEISQSSNFGSLRHIDQSLTAIGLAGFIPLIGQIAGHNGYESSFLVTNKGRIIAAQILATETTFG